jgi:hypothetical protein
MTEAETTLERWSPERARAWYFDQPWLVGCNFIPSTAINQLEMWQAETFDRATIDRELGWAARLGMNTIRVFLHDLLWNADPDGLCGRISSFLSTAAKHGIATMFVLFDDCWHDGAKLGPQPHPVPGQHNSGWLQAPGHSVIASRSALPRLEAYVRGVVGAFANDNRIVAWDIYNEITNGFLPGQALAEGDREAAYEAALRKRAERMPLHLELLDLAFAWARSASPQQPLTAGMFLPDRVLNDRLASLSDVISFHCYESSDRLSTLIARLRRHERPLLCTEYMARTRGSDFRAALPVFKRDQVGCYNWGLVNGKTQTHISWTGESGRWFHDILRADGTPYDDAEVALIREVTGTTGRKPRHDDPDVGT